MKELDVVYEYYLNPVRQSMFGVEVQRAMDEFMGNGTQLPVGAFPHFADWFIFDFTCTDGLTPMRRFSETNLLYLSPDEQDAYSEIAKNNRFDFFEVSELKKQNAVFTGLRDGKRYDVGFECGVQIDDGDIIVCRIARIRGIWRIVSRDPIGMPKPSARDRKRMTTSFPKFDPRIVYHEIIAIEDAMGDSMVPEMSMEDFGNGISSITFGDHTRDDDCSMCRDMKRTSGSGSDDGANVEKTERSHGRTGRKKH